MPNDDKIPLEKVLDDMYNPNGGVVSWAARDYYYIHYASDKQRKKMDREDIISIVVDILILAIIVMLGVAVFMKGAANV